MLRALAGKCRIWKYFYGIFRTLGTACDT
jgi:hypothetical protein